MKVLNRSNELVDFDEEKLFSGIKKASLSTKENGLIDNNKETICAKVLELLKESHINHPTVVDINNIIPKALIQEGFVETAEKFIIYATKHKMARGSNKVDPITTIDEYINKEDWRIKANANQGYSLGGMILNSSGKISANYWLDNIYPEDAGFAHRNGDIHIHDLDMLSGYCFTGDTKVYTKEYGDIEIKDLASKGISNQFTVLAYDSINDKIVEAKAYNARLTRTNAEVVEVKLVRNEVSYSIKCTPDHMFLTTNDIFKSAASLTPEDFIMDAQDFINGMKLATRVESVEKVEGTFDTYDLEVNIHHNFALSDSLAIVHNCAGWSLKSLLNEGFNGIPGKIESLPPKNLSAAIGQMVNFLGSLQNEFAGAQAFSSFDTYLAPFVRKLKYEIERDYIECQEGSSVNAEKLKEWTDKKLYKEVYQNMQVFIYNLNVPSRWGTQTPFTNVTFDIKCPDSLRDVVPMIGGIPVNELEFFKDREFTYGDLEEEMALVTKCYFQVMGKGDAKGQIFTFPIPTINVGKRFDWNDPTLDDMWEAEAKYGLAYFQNFVNSDLDESMIRSMCCRLQLDLHELLKRGNGLFGSAEQTGSIGVVTINCARLGYLAKGNKDELYERLDILLELGKKVLETKRKFLNVRLRNGFYPFAKRYLGTWRNHFNTIGVNGINEMLLNFNGESTATPEGVKFAEEFLEHIRLRLKEFQQETGNMYNLEATPGEGTCYRFAKEDKKHYPDIIQAGSGDNIYYNNSSQLPVGYTDDIFEALTLQEGLQRKYTGGSVLHLFLGERVANGEIAKNIIKKCFENFKIPYLTLTPTFSVCPIHGYIPGEHEYCPICDEKIIQNSLDCESCEK